MKIIIAPDSFKESLRASEICQAIARGILLADPQAEIDAIGLSDGGEGFIDALIGYGDKVKYPVRGPLGEVVEAGYIIAERAEGKTAFIEMSAAAGLELVTPGQRNPLRATTYGVGELILDAYTRGCRSFYLGLGGSATVDCGCGMAQALGVRFYDRDNQLIGEAMCPELNIRVKYFDFDQLRLDLAVCRFTAICDVKNPLLGPTGAAIVYGPQKGATSDQILQLEQANSSLVSIIENTLGRKLRNIPGAGAAGGLAIAIMAFLNGTIEPGIQAVLKETHFSERIKGADLIITGEGAIDHTTANGKVISGVLKAAQGIPVVALCGSINCDLNPLHQLGLTAAYSISPGPEPLAQALANTAANLTRTAEQIVRMMRHR